MGRRRRSVAPRSAPLLVLVDSSRIQRLRLAVRAVVRLAVVFVRDPDRAVRIVRPRQDLLRTAAVPAGQLLERLRTVDFGELEAADGPLLGVPSGLGSDDDSRLIKLRADVPGADIGRTAGEIRALVTAAQPRRVGNRSVQGPRDWFLSGDNTSL